MSNLEDKDAVSVRIPEEKQEHSSSVEENGKHVSQPMKPKHTKKISPWELSSTRWNIIFLVSCLVGITIDPLFLYIPIIDEDEKCLKMDVKMKDFALVMRFVTDMVYVLHILYRLRGALALAKELDSSIFRGLPWSYLLIDILAMLPIPQVVVLVYFSMVAGSRSLTTRKFLNLFLLLQYVPRILRIYLSAKYLGSVFFSLTTLVWVRGAFNFLLYIIAGHVLGALWYFYSIFRETACWHDACLSQPGCVPSNAFDCHRNNTPLFRNVKFFNDICPVSPPNSTVFNSGIYADAIESGILGTTDFPRKLSHCFWWGLRNLSSFGQNLETSSNTWENCFVILISILGLLLFLYLIGNLQTYMQLATQKFEETRENISAKKPEIKSYLSDHGFPELKKKFIMRHIRQRTITEGKDFDVKKLLSFLDEHIHAQKKSETTFADLVTNIVDVRKREKNSTMKTAELWISRNNAPHNIKKDILRYVKLRMQEGKVVDIGNLLPILPYSVAMSIKKHLCLTTLRKVPMLKNMNEKVYETMCGYLKPITYLENNYIIKKGEPLDLMLFITQGTVWSFGEETGSMERLQRGDFYGKELLEWRFKSASYSMFPISTNNVKAHTKLEAFVLKASDLELILTNFWWMFSHLLGQSVLESLTMPLLATSLQRKYRRHAANKKEKDQNQPSGENDKRQM